MAVAEQYLNTYAQPSGRICLRWWVHPSVMVGGNVLDRADWKHLHDTYGIRSVLNVDHISDVGKGIGFLSECPVPDDGTRLPRGLVRHAVSFARMHAGMGRIYVHCHAGVSRSPAFAYAVLRWAFDMGPDEALRAIRAGGGELGESYGVNPKQRAYLDSVESALRDP